MKRALITLAVAVMFFLSVFLMSRNAVSKCSNSVTKGKTLYDANCLSCHGDNGEIHHINRERRRSFIKEVLGGNSASEREKRKDENDNDGSNIDSDNDENDSDSGSDIDSDTDSSESSSMPSFKGTLSKKEVKTIHRYLKKPNKVCNGGSSGNGNGNVQNPTYTSNISSILSTYCTACHKASSSAGGISLDTYANAVANASTLKTAVDNGIMPPSGALSADLVTTIDNWIANSTPE